MSDMSLRQDVIDELEFEPSLDAAKIGVAVKNGVVTLMGYVNSYLLLVAGFHVRCLQNVIKKRNWGRWQVDATIL